MEDYKVIQTRIVLPGDTNAHQTLFGGKMMSYIDDVSAIAAAKYARRIFVTGSTDSVDFIYPIKVNDSVQLEAFVSGTGHKSLEVFCRITGESLMTGQIYLAATAFTTFVLVDDNPTSLRQFKPVTKEQQLVNHGYEARKNARKLRRLQNNEFIESLEKLSQK